MRKAAVLLLLILIGCSPDETSNRSTLPPSSGAPAEMVVVMDDHLWEGPVGEAIRNTFAIPVQGLPQAEPMFRLVHLNRAGFSKLLKRTHSLVLVDVDSVTRNTIRKDLFARPQAVLRASAPTEEELRKLILEHKEVWRQAFNDFNIEFLQNRFRKISIGLPRDLREHGYNMLLPKSFEPGIDEPSLKVFWSRSLRSDQGILIYTRPMPEDPAFLGTDIIAVRDSITKSAVPGERPGSYMRVEDLVPPVVNSMEMAGKYTLETRGLWRTEGDFLGGPFISYTIYDEEHGRIITLDGFVFAPEMDKRHLMLELEAVLRSFTIN